MVSYGPWTNDTIQPVGESVYVCLFKKTDEKVRSQVPSVDFQITSVQFAWNKCKAIKFAKG